MSLPFRQQPRSSRSNRRPTDAASAVDSPADNSSSSRNTTSRGARRILRKINAAEVITEADLLSRVDDSLVKLKAARRGKEDSDFLIEQCFKDIHKGVAEPLKTAEEMDAK